MSISVKAMKILTVHFYHLFDLIATQAASIARFSKRTVISTSDVQTAVQLTLPPQIAHHATLEGIKAVNAYYNED